jgi:hypothetical protein
MSDRPKIENLLDRIVDSVESGNYRFSNHARQRMAKRGVDPPEVRYVLRTGWHEARKDQWQEAYEAWNYAIRGSTVDDREVRVVVTFEGSLLGVTVIDLNE